MDRPIFDTNSDWRSPPSVQVLVGELSWLLFNGRLCQPAKTVENDDYWIAAKRPKVMAALRRALPSAELDLLTATLKLLMMTNTIQLDGSLSSHITTLEKSLLLEAFIIPSVFWNRILVCQTRLFLTAVDDCLQRDIIGLNDTFKPFRSDVIGKEN